MITKKRLLIPISLQFSVRYILRSKVIEALQKFCIPVLLLNWKDNDFENELRAKGIEFYSLPVSDFGKVFNYIAKIKGFKYTRRVKSVSTAIDKRRNLLVDTHKRSAKQRLAVAILNILSYFLPDIILEKIENMEVKKRLSFRESLELLKGLNIDTVLTLTPFFSDEFLMLKCFEELSVPIIYSVLSFDNLTTRGYLPVEFDHFFVWNTMNKNEVLRIFGKDTKVDIVGPVQFDFYWDDNYIWEKERWKKELKIETDRPIILFGAGHYTIVPNEPEWLLDIDKAISNGEVINNPVILFRRHPYDPVSRWVDVLSKCKNVVFEDSWKLNEASLGKSNTTNYDIAKLCSTLQWTDVHINASSTLTLDGAIFNKPQIGPAYSTNSNTLSIILKDLYFREHYLPITKSGGLRIAYSLNELINHLNEALTNPEKYSIERKAMVDEFCEGTYGESAIRLAECIHKYFDRKT